MDWLTFFSDVVGSIAWPVAIVVVILVFRDQLAKLLPSLEALEYKDFKLKFEKRVAQAEKQFEDIVDTQASSERAVVGEDRFDTARTLAAVAPSAAIVEAWKLFEYELRDGARRMNLDVSATLPVHRLLRDLEQRGLLPRDVVATAQELRGLRNEAAHVPDMYLPSEHAEEYVSLIARLTSFVRGRL